MFWTFLQWRTILWSDEVTFLLRAKKAKKRCIRNKTKRCYPDCVQFQMYRGGTTPVHFFGAIGHDYKSSLVHIVSTGKNGAFKQVNYLGQVLQLYIQSFLVTFKAICSTPHFIEDSNSAHGHKSTNPCAR
jgi:hypothetical protein